MSTTRSDLPRPDPRALALATRFLSVVAGDAPSLVCRAYLTGSAITGDWQAAHSDIDMVFVVARPVTAVDEAGLSKAHAATRGRNCVDGVYLTEDQLEVGPSGITSAPQVIDGAFTLDRPGGQLNGVTWLELSRAPVARVDNDGTVSWHDPQPLSTDPVPAAAAYSRENLGTYWTGVVDQWQAALDSGELTDERVDTDSVVWTVLGPARLIVTIETGVVISKTASGQFAAERWPQYGRLVERAMRSRAGGQETFDVEDVRAVISLGRLVVEAGRSAVTVTDRG